MRLLLFLQLISFACLAQKIELIIPGTHSDQIISYHHSRNEMYLLTAGEEGKIILWEAETGKFLREYWEKSKLSGAYLLHDNASMVVQLEDRLYIRELQSGKILQELGVASKVLLPSRVKDEFVVLTDNPEILIYRKVKSQYELVKRVEAKAPPTGINYSQSGNELLYLDDAWRSLNLITWATRELKFNGLEQKTITCLGLNTDQSSYAIGTKEGDILLYDISKQQVRDSIVWYSSNWIESETGKLKKDSSAVKRSLMRIDFISHDRLLTFHQFTYWGNSGYSDGELYVWNLKTKKQEVSLGGANVPSISYSDNLVFGLNSVYFINLRTGFYIGRNSPGGLESIQMSGDGQVLAIQNGWKENRRSRTRTFIWNMAAGTTDELRLDFAQPQFSMHQNTIGIYNSDSAVSIRSEGYSYPFKLYDVQSKKVSKRMKSARFFGEAIFNPSRNQVLFPNRHLTSVAYTTVLDFVNDKVVAILENHSRISFSRDGKYMAADQSLFETDRYKGVDSVFSRSKNYRSQTLILSAAGMWLTSKGNRIGVRDFRNRITLDSLTLPASITSLSGSYNEKLIFAGLSDGQVLVLDAQTRKIVTAFRAHDSPVQYVDVTGDDKRLVTADAGSIRFWNVSDYSEIVRVVFFGQDWVAMSPDYLFDGSAGGLERLFFLDGLKTIELNQLKERFYEPGLLQKILGYSKEPLRRSAGLDQIQSYPLIELDDPNKNEKHVLTIRLVNQGGGIGPVKILINGKEATPDARPNPVNPNAPRLLINFPLENHPYIKENDVNHIEVLAFNKDEYLQSKPKKTFLIADGDKQTNIRMFAVIVGTSDYSGTDLDLRYAAKDARQFELALGESAKKLLGNTNVQIHLLTTDGAKETWPNKTNVENAFRSISKVAAPNDLLVVYLAGHGTNYGGAEGDFYYLAADAKNGDLADPAVRSQVAISSSELTEYIRWVPSLKQVLILDACHSGKFADDLMAKREAKSSSEVRALERMKDRTGLYILAGSAADAVSYEASTFGQGLLTYSLLFGIKGASLRENVFVDVMQLFQYAADEVPRLAENIGGIQKPEVKVPFSAQSFDIGMVDEETKSKIILPTPKPIFLRSVFQDEDTFGDPLGLSEYLDKYLKNQSASRASGGIIFIDATKFQDGYSLRGRYRKTGNSYEVVIKLLKGENVFHETKASGSNLEELGDKIVKSSLEIIGPHKLN